MKILKDILYRAGTIDTLGSTQVSINNIHLDSRKISNGDLYIAIKGLQVDGHQFIESAIKKGAKAIICEEFPESIQVDISYIKVKNSSIALGYIASNFYDNPSENIKLVGITGTNGKTTTATLLYNLFKKLGYKTGLISTVVNYIDNEAIASTHTTPDAISINKLLSNMADAACEYVFMEVSSHAIAQHRIEGLNFAGGIFTNISHDHLDYHKTFDEYIKTKKKFFDTLPKNAFSLTNKDHKQGMVMVQNTVSKIHTYGIKSMVDFKTRIVENQLSGMLLKVNNQELYSTLIGDFNAYNLTAVFATAKLLEQDELEVLTALSSLSSVDGRFQQFISKSKITTIIDYAHTPDALENVLKTISAIRTNNETLFTVVGCGGNRDAKKRPIMANIACKYSNQVVITSDNPRNEDPQEIIKQMENGVEPQDYKKTISIIDRAEAIKMACKMANTNDIILIAGKGHEKYQEIKGEKFPFDDYEIVKETLNKLDK